MVAVGSSTIRQISDAIGDTYSFVERATRPLIGQDLFPSRGRKETRAGDLKSLLNAIIAGTAADAIENNAILSALEYKGSWPAGAGNVPALGGGTWGELLERLIETSPSWRPFASEAADGNVEVTSLPHTIEVCMRPLSVILVWLDGSGQPKRRDIYGPVIPEPVSTGFLVRKVFFSSALIQVAADILRKTKEAAGGPTPAASKSKTKQAAKPADPSNQQLKASHTSAKSGVRGLPISKRQER